MHETNKARQTHQASTLEDNQTEEILILSEMNAEVGCWDQMGATSIY